MKARLQNRNRHPFNLIEIILALVIILVGVVSIMALFPVGQEASRSAIGRTSASDAGDQFLRYYSSKLKSRWALVNTIPINRPADDAETDVVWQSIDTTGIFTGTHSEVQGVQFFYNDENNNSKFDYRSGSKDDSGLFMISQRTTEHIEDFSGVVRVWKTPATHPSYDSVTGNWAAHNPVSPNAGVTLNVEISWPAGLPYARREKASYTMDVFRPVTNQLQEINGAFQIAENGRLKVTFHGSDAGWKSAFYMTKPTEELIFASNQHTDQLTEWETEYTAGTEFNFHIKTTPGGSYWQGQYGLYEHYAWAPPPINEHNCDCRSIDGSLNINPNNSPQNEFTLVKKSGGTITRDDLHRTSPTGTGGVYWSGSATLIKVKPKGNGNQNTILVNGTVYPLKNSTLYTFENTDMQVTIYNDHIKKGKAMGHWWLSVDGDCATIRADDEDHDELCPAHPNYTGPGTTLVGEPPYFDDPPNNYNGATHVTTGNPYCMVTDMIPGRKWLLRYEDLPGSHPPDWDYNDQVVTIELLTDDGIAANVAATDVTGTVTLDNGSDYQFNLVKGDGTMFTENSIPSGGYNGPAISLWTRPAGSGSQSLTVGGTSSSFDNDTLVSVCASSSNMNVKIFKSGGKWKATITASDAQYVVMD